MADPRQVFTRLTGDIEDVAALMGTRQALTGMTGNHGDRRQRQAAAAAAAAAAALEAAVLTGSYGGGGGLWRRRKE